jgi:hypothetical protein
MAFNTAQNTGSLDVSAINNSSANSFADNLAIGDSFTIGNTCCLLGRICVSHRPQIGHEVGVLREHLTQFLTHPLSFVLDGREYDLCRQAANEKRGTWMQVGLFAELGGKGNSAILAEMKLNDGFHDSPTHCKLSPQSF